MNAFDKIEVPDNPWEEIKRSNSENILNTRRVDYRYPHDFYWTKNSSGSYGLRLSSDSKLEALEKPPTISGLEVTKQNEGGGASLDLTLLDKNSSDLFRTICIDLLYASSQKGKDSYDALAHAILNRLKRWQELMAKPKGSLLSREGQLGLYGELLILRDFFLKKIVPRSAFSAWIGPDNSAQDFQHLNLLLEIKTQFSIRPVKISSLEQLNPGEKELFLIHQLLEETEKDGLTLQELVNRIRKEYASKDVVSSDLFERSLLDAGYRDNDFYNKHLWKLESRKGYMVNGEFPSLTSHNVHNLIQSAEYTVKIESCREFNAKISEIESKINGGSDD